MHTRHELKMNEWIGLVSVRTFKNARSILFSQSSISVEILCNNRTKKRRKMCVCYSFVFYIQTKLNCRNRMMNIRLRVSVSCASKIYFGDFECLCDFTLGFASTFLCSVCVLCVFYEFLLFFVFIIFGLFFAVFLLFFLWFFPVVLSFLFLAFLSLFFFCSCNDLTGFLLSIERPFANDQRRK